MLAAAALNYQVVSYAGAYVSAPRADVVMGAKSKAKGVKEFRKGANKFSYIDVATGKEYVETSSAVSAQFDEIGVLPPIGRWDPLKIREQGPERYRRFVEMEIKHGRLAMAAFLGVITTYSGFRFPGYLSNSLQLKFEDVPGTMIGSWAAIPERAWIQIVFLVALLEADIFKQDPEKAPGDVVPEGWLWARYPDGYTVWLGDGSEKTVAEDELFLGKTWKLNAERNNGRAAMMGITGMLIHEGLTGNPVWPIPVPPQPVLESALDDIEKGPARVGSFVLASLGMTFAGAIAAIPEFGKKS